MISAERQHEIMQLKFRLADLHLERRNEERAVMESYKRMSDIAREMESVSLRIDHLKTTEEPTNVERIENIRRIRNSIESIPNSGVFGVYPKDGNR